MTHKLKTFNRDTAWLVILIALALAAAAVAIVGFKKRLQSDSVIFQNKSEIRFGQPNLPHVLEVNNVTTVEDYEILMKIHKGLVALDQSGRIYPGAAKNWTVMDGGKQILFQLRTHLEFSSGKPFRCGDVLETYEHLKESRDASLWALSMVKGMECKSDFQFLVTLERPSPFFLIELADVRYSIRRADSFTNAKGPDLDGLGPYRIANFEPDTNSIVLVRRDGNPFVTTQAPLKIHYAKIENLEEAMQKLKAGDLDLYPLRGHLVDSGKIIVSSHRVDRVWMLVLSRNIIQKYPLFTRCLNSQMKRENILASIKDQAFTKTSTVVTVDDENSGDSQNRLLLGAFNSADEDDCSKAFPRTVRLMALEGHDPRIVDSISHELKRLSIQTRKMSIHSKDEFAERLSGDSYDIALDSIGSAPSPVSDLAFFFIRNHAFPPSAWVNSNLSKLAKKITLSRNEMEAHERIFNVLGQSLRHSPLVALFFEKERFLSGKCVKIIDSDHRLSLDQQLASIVREEGCHD